MGRDLLNRLRCSLTCAAGCRMGDAGATALAVGVKMSGALETLNLDREWPNVLIHTPHGWACCSRVRTAASADNEIGDAGATALAEGVGASTRLTDLYLDGESIQEHSVRRTCFKCARRQRHWDGWDACAHGNAEVQLRAAAGARFRLRGRACVPLPRAARAVHRSHPRHVPGGQGPHNGRAWRHRGVAVRARAALGCRARLRAAARTVALETKPWSIFGDGRAL